MKIVAIDYGKTKFGTAYSEGELASPGEVVQVSGLNDALQKVGHIINKFNPEVLVIGQPESGEARQITDKFIKALGNGNINQGIKIIVVEETLSTKRGQEAMVSLGLSQKRRSQDDAYAAAEILEEYLENAKKKSTTDI